MPAVASVVKVIKQTGKSAAKVAGKAGSTIAVAQGAGVAKAANEEKTKRQLASERADVYKAAIAKWNGIATNNPTTEFAGDDGTNGDSNTGDYRYD